MTFLRALAVVLSLVWLPGIVSADAPDASPRPVPRMEAAPPAPPMISEEAPLRAPRPEPRPRRMVKMVLPQAVHRSPRPSPRPDNLRRRAEVAQAPVRVRTGDRARNATRAGSVCGVAEIKGQAIATIPGRIAGCGIDAPVKVTSVSGVRLSQAATIDCTTAKALNTWVRQGVIPAVGRLGGGVAGLKVIAHYSCRTRNNRPGAKISEHGKGHAVDVAGVILKNGTTLTVLEGWRDRQQSRILKAMHASACGPFGTVLGPNADSYHQDHLHVDTARYRSGSYCR